MSITPTRVSLVVPTVNRMAELTRTHGKLTLSGIQGF